MHKVGVNLMTIKPGFVDASMTVSLKKGAVSTKPDKVVSCILACIDAAGRWSTLRGSGACACCASSTSRGKC